MESKFKVIEEKTVRVNDIDIHYAEYGKGPHVILFVHGFPELWYSWRHQILALGELGYRAVAPNLRGYFGSYSPEDIKDYSCLDIVGDVFGLLDAIAPDQKQVYLVGHDWGAILAWYMCMFRPDKFRALVNLSLIFLPRDPKQKPVEQMRDRFGPDYYVTRFQEPGVIEAEFDHIGTRNVLNGIYNVGPEPLLLPKDNYFKPPPPRPHWLSEKDLEYYVQRFQKSGFSHPINYYRNLDRNWELTATWNGAPVNVPAMFIVGDQDLTYNSYDMKEYVDGGKYRNDVPNLEETIVIKGASHFIQQERFEEINCYIINFVKNHPITNF